MSKAIDWAEIEKLYCQDNKNPAEIAKLYKNLTSKQVRDRAYYYRWADNRHPTPAAASVAFPSPMGGISTPPPSPATDTMEAVTTALIAGIINKYTDPLALETLLSAKHTNALVLWALNSSVKLTIQNRARSPKDTSPPPKSTKYIGIEDAGI